jgi:hypothetical protein
MKKLFIAAVATASIGAGWTIGKAQTAVADFEITVDAPTGTTNIICNRGCAQSSTWMRRQGSEGLTATFSCTSPTRCIGTVDGQGLVIRGR